ncbi:MULTISPECIES: biotin--[acetyl-CoA-carboxylase] ligase [Rhodopseudomonas]|uniref:biotin--[biotin carboxyl-carrier protein] ligase n=1 Tax=Rhodopseudomonas palustris TaxID=1076 RepID=A0A0D7E8C1_RHOPL|nr:MULTISPECIES: biotin--[acetyl-CoA-carboxylase] ligase [Rhodopseudomonas]KIZ36871.1 biotin [Rhodopseudomonas palustris]MDF3812692.1 biotin--[acetyl-CoA-carboxylase] ligase [Rhodopseudomonas sp. BAL398]WOK18954.1 biotin--[acetyl-CoA-carboxylase] ligase [Rhodopseudomonas sp. BAL398]
MVFSLGPKSRAAGTGVKVFAETGSTNIDAMDHARAGGAAPCWFVTTIQTAGRGRRNRPWVAPRGNLASSVFEILNVTPPVAATLGFAAGIAVEMALRQVSVEAAMRAPDSAANDYRLKWPNDILAGGAKLVGMNLEAEARPDGQLAVVVGIGINVVAAPEGTPYRATSLNALGVGASAEDVFAALSDSWHEMRGIWNNGRGFPQIRTMWLERAAGLGQAVSISHGTSVVSGIFDTIDDTGCMIVTTADRKRIPIAAGDVYFGDAASAKATN